MSAEEILVTAATGETGRYTVKRLVEKGHAVRALVHREDERSDALRSAGAKVVVGDLLEHDDAIRATAGTTAAYFCYPIRPGLIQATAYFADAAKSGGRCQPVADIRPGEFQEPRGARSLDRRTCL